MIFLYSCPLCQKRCNVKSGFNRSGSQRYYCKLCKTYFTPKDAHTLKREQGKELALSLYLVDHSLRAIARELGIHHQTVKTWIDPELQRLREKAGQLSSRGMSVLEILEEMEREIPDGISIRRVTELVRENQPKLIQKRAI